MAAAEEAFSFLGCDFEANLKFITKNEIKRLNNSYRGLDASTDVLSFKLDDENGGDIVICLEIAKKEASEWGITVGEILQLLTVHGILHLASYDHENDQDRVKMEGAERKILKKVGVDIG